jgi:hypothetical protein
MATYSRTELTGAGAKPTAPLERFSINLGVASAEVVEIPALAGV